MNMILIKDKCPKCHGNLFLEQDSQNRTVQKCLQCSYSMPVAMRDVPEQIKLSFGRK